MPASGAPSGAAPTEPLPQNRKEAAMLYVILWLLGMPLTLIIILAILL